MFRIGRWAGAAAATVGFAALLAGCDLVGPATPTAVVSTPPTATPTPELSRGYLSASPTDAQYFDFTEVATAITGSFERTSQGTSLQPPTAQSVNLSVNGRQAGTQLSLTLSDGTAITGTIAADGTLTLMFPQPNGALQNFTFAPATTDAYNSAAAVVNSQAAAEGTLSYWASQAQTSSACTVAVSGTYASATLVGSDALSICEEAIHASFASAAGINSNATNVVCVYSVNSSRLGVTDGGGLGVGTQLCKQVSSMAFPNASPP